jgi:hypothetical protein
MSQPASWDPGMSLDCPELFTEYPGVESIKYYCKGGFDPIHIDNVLQNCYCIINKLGYGAYGTIWLIEARGHQPDNPRWGPG